MVEYELYPVVAEWDDKAHAWSLLAPDFPEIASVAARREDIAQMAKDAIDTAIEVRREGGEDVPRATEDMAGLMVDWAMPTRNMLVHVPVAREAAAPEPVRVNVSLDRALLARIDSEAGRRGMSRSGFLAEGARALLRS